MFILYLVFNGYPEKGLWKMESIQPKGQRDNKMYSVLQNNLSTISSNHMPFTCINMDLNYNFFQSGSIAFITYLTMSIRILDVKPLQMRLQLNTYTRSHCSQMISLWTMCVNIKWVFTKVIRICFM